MKKYFLFSILITNLLYPQQSSLSKGVNHLTEFIASEYFNELKKNNNDLKLIDSIYLRAVSFYNGDIDEALLALTFAIIPYKRVPVQIPILKKILRYPLTSHNDSLFLLKNENIPGQFFFDSPQNNYGDKDKPAHFFGSAYISYQSNIFDLGDLIGYFVEVFEENFKVQSKIDERDLQVNKMGNLFGKILKENKEALPSHIMIMNSIKHFYYNP